MKNTSKKKENSSVSPKQKSQSPKEEKVIKQKDKSPERGKSKGKSKNKDKKGKDQKEDAKKTTNIYNLDFIFRRTKYTLNKLSKAVLVSKIKKLIGAKLTLDPKELKFYYKENELTSKNDNSNFYEMIKNDKYPFLEVKKEIKINEDIISLTTKINLIYKVKCSPISEYKDFVSKIEQFFKDLCLEKHYICEPVGNNEYYACFSCSDHCFQFKRYMMNVARTDKLYTNSTFEILKVDKTRIVEPKIYKNSSDDNVQYGNKIEKIVSEEKGKEIEYDYRKIVHRKNDYFQKEFINSGPYDSYDKLKKKEEEEDKKKWVSKKKFSVI